MTPRFPHLILFAAALLLSACVYQSPLAEKPTGRIDERLLGDWVLKNDDGKLEHMSVVKLDDSHYIVNYDNMILHAWETDVGGTRFISAQNISAQDDSERLYVFLTYELQDDGRKLVIRTVNQETISAKLKTSAELRKAVEDNLKNVDLFNKDAGVFTRPATATHE